MEADYDGFLERKRAERYDGGNEDEPHDEDEAGNEEEEDEQGERADAVAALHGEEYERRAQIEMDAEDDERCLKGWRDL
jgi:hypothetical protein